MFPKNKRVPRSLFPLPSDKTKTFRNKLFLLRLVFGGHGSHFCFSVSKKISNKAVVRNKLRRIGYRLLEKHLSDITSPIVAIFSFRTTPLNDTDVAESLESILKESKLIK